MHTLGFDFLAFLLIISQMQTWSGLAIYTKSSMTKTQFSQTSAVTPYSESMQKPHLLSNPPGYHYAHDDSSRGYLQHRRITILHAYTNFRTRSIPTEEDWPSHGIQGDRHLAKRRSRGSYLPTKPVRMEKGIESVHGKSPLVHMFIEKCKSNHKATKHWM